MAQFQTHKTIHNTARMVTINHPNAFDAVCFKRVFTTPTGLNQIAGIDVLGGEDTPDISYQELGMAKVLFVDAWQASNVIADAINANDERIKLTALIEPDIENEFVLGKQDLFYLYIEEGLALCYEIVGIENPIGLPTALNARRYVLNKRDDLDYLPDLPYSDKGN